MILVDFVAELPSTLFEELVRAVEFRQHRERRGVPKTDPIQPGAGEWATIAEVERAHVLSILRAVDGNRTLAAKALGIGERTLFRKLASYGIGRKFKALAEDAAT